MEKKEKTLPSQHQKHQPGVQTKMDPAPKTIDKTYHASNRLLDKVAIITGGDSGIGRSVAVMYALEGADVAIVYLEEHDDAKETQKMVEATGRKCLLISGDIGESSFSKTVVKETLKAFGKIDIVINNAAEQHPQDDFENITEKQLLRTYHTNIFAQFFLVKEALPHLKAGSCIINTASITAYHGKPDLVDYSSTKGAVVSFTRSLSGNLMKKGIRVNAVAPGPIWTPLIPSSFSADKVEVFGSETPMGRPGQPREVAPCYVFLASDDASYITGQVIHPNGGTIVNG